MKSEEELDKLVNRVLKMRKKRMKYYKISEEELKKLTDKVLNNPVEDEYHDAKFIPETGKLEITGHYGIYDRTIQFEELKDGLDISKLEGAVWHGCPKTHAHTEFTELKFKGNRSVSGFCIHCEEEMVRLDVKE